MNGITRAISTLAGVAAAGALLWVAAQVGRHSTGGYWAAYAIVAAAGLALGLSQMRGRTGHPPAMFALGFLPVLVVAGWVLIAQQPNGNWFRSHVLSWSGDLGVREVVRDVGIWLGVLALAIGYTLGAMLEPAPRRRVVPAYDAPADDEPRTAERHDVAATTEEPAPVS
ncbi:MAG TPA: hypothetical protein VMU73_12040 [Gaiellaceae bacterium]|nr:hypothetical protein [Gaiellaceae bacterium]